MPKHKLFSDSLESLDFNSDMESIKNQTSSPPATSSRNIEIDRNQNCRDKPEIDSTQCSTDSDDFLNDADFFIDSERRRYTYDEDVQILKFVLKDQNIYKVTSILLWKYLEAKKKNPKRSYQSLKNRFLRNIKPKIFMTYRNVIENEDQVRKILEKFPELKKDANIKKNVLSNLKPRKANEAVRVQKVQKADLNEGSGEIRMQPPLQIDIPEVISQSEYETRMQPPLQSNTPEIISQSEYETRMQPPLQSNTPEIISQSECDTAIGEESTARKVEFCRRSIIITVSRSLTTCASHSNGIKSQLGIYEKYLNCKAKNKLVPCPTCGRCGEPELNEVQDSENEYDVIISGSFENKNSKSSQNTTIPQNKTNISDYAVNKNVKRNENRKAKPPSESSQDSLDSYGLFLDCVKSPEKAERQNRSSTQSKSSPTKTARSNSSDRKYFTPPAEQRSEHLTDKELESLYQESMQKCEKLMSSEEEEVLVKKCLKKNRRSFGFDSYVLLTKCSLDSFFAKSNSPSLEDLSADPVTSAEITGSPLVENMKKMLRSKKYKKS